MNITNLSKTIEREKSDELLRSQSRNNIRPEVAIIILNWNAAADTIDCIHNVAAFQQIQSQIWVVDNNSSDDSADRIAAEWPQVNLIRNSVNVGYAGGNNCALAEILEGDSEFVLLLNNDAHIDEENLLHLMAALQSYSNIGIVGPLMFDADQPDRLLNAGGQNPVLHLTSHVTRLGHQSRLQLVDYLPGTVMLARREVFQKTDLLDESYFFSTEIPDFCRRARQQGYLSTTVPKARAYHAVDRSSTFRASLYVYYIIRNRFRFIGKFYPTLKIFLFGFWTLYSVALSTKLYLEGNSVTAKAVLLGLADGLRGRFGGQNERVLAACGGQRPSSLDELL